MLALATIAGALFGILCAAIPASHMLSNKTVESRAKKILKLIEIQKTRPLTCEEFYQIYRLATFSVNNQEYCPQQNPTIEITHELAKIDNDYYNALMSGKLDNADTETQNAIKNGYIASHPYEYQMADALQKIR